MQFIVNYVAADANFDRLVVLNSCDEAN